MSKKPKGINVTLKGTLQYLNETGPQRRKKVTSFIANGFVYFLLIDFALIFILPFLYMFTRGMMSPADIQDTFVRWIPKRGIIWLNYGLAFYRLNYVRSLLQTILVAGIATAAHVFSGSFIGYGFSRLKFPGKNFFFAILIFTLIVPPQVLIVPNYLMYSKLSLVDTYVPLLFPTFIGWGLRGGLFIFVFRQIFLNMPYELEDAARIDGCSSFGTYWRIIMPIATSAILVVSILSFVWHWNDYYEPYMYLGTPNKFLMPMRLPELRNPLRFEYDEVPDYYPINIVMAGTTITILPVFILYLIFQRRFTEGIERSGLVG